jgi:hypothetical protein
MPLAQSAMTSEASAIVRATPLAIVEQFARRHAAVG